MSTYLDAIVGGPASALATTGAPVNVGDAAPPNPGDVLKAVDATHAAWAPGSGGDADGLGTTGDPVDVASAAPPVAGQVLTATDAEHAEWRVPGLHYDPSIKFWTASAGSATIASGSWGFIAQPTGGATSVVVYIVSSLEAPPVDARFGLYVARDVTVPVTVQVVGASQIQGLDGVLGPTTTLLPGADYEWVFYHEDSAALWGLVSDTAGVAKGIRTASGIVSVASAAAPNAGDVFTALSATQGHWAPPAASSSWSVAANINPKHWWRANNVVATGGLVDTIVDNGTGAKNFTQTGAARAPTAVDANSKTYLALDGTADFYTAGVAADWKWMHDGTKMWTLFIVMQPPTLSTTGTYQAVLATSIYSSSATGVEFSIGLNGGDAGGFPNRYFTELGIWGGAIRNYAIWNVATQDTRKGVYGVRCTAFNSPGQGVDWTAFSAAFADNRQSQSLQIWKGDAMLASSRSPDSGTVAYLSAANPNGALRLSGFTDGPKLTGAKIYEVLLTDRALSNREMQQYAYYAEAAYGLDLAISV